MSHEIGWNKPMRDYRKDFTLKELYALVDRFICLYTREPAEEWHHSTEEMMAVLQEAKDCQRLRDELDQTWKALKESNEIGKEMVAQVNRLAAMLENRQ